MMTLGTTSGVIENQYSCSFRFPFPPAFYAGFLVDYESLKKSITGDIR